MVFIYSCAIKHAMLFMSLKCLLISNVLSLYWAVCICPPLETNYVIDTSFYDGAACCTNCHDMEPDHDYFFFVQLLPTCRQCSYNTLQEFSSVC